MKIYRLLLRIQGVFFFLTGVWPLVHIRSFIWVTGPKNDIWLVKTVGLTIVACSLGMLAASFRKFIQPDVIVILLGFSLFLAGVDIYYNITDVIAPIYLADAVVELLFVLIWLWWWRNIKPEKEVLKNEKK
jgi:hypothetical protein